jgi:hypothetical protein
MVAKTTANYSRIMALLKPTPTPDPSQDDYCQPVDALKGLPLRTTEIRRSYRLSDKKMLQVQQAASINKRSSSADRVRSSAAEIESSRSPPPPPLPSRGPPSNPPPDYEEPWDFRRKPASSAPKNGKVEQVPPVPKAPADQEYEDPWDSVRMRRGFSKPLEPLPPLPPNIPSSAKPRNGERTRRSTVNSVLPSEPQVDIDTNKSLEEQLWYHGMLPRHEAEELLEKKPDFSFLVRKSETSRFSYSLSLK